MDESTVVVVDGGDSLQLSKRVKLKLQKNHKS